MGNLIHYAVAILIVAVITAILGFSGATSITAGGAWVLLCTAVLLCVGTLLAGLSGKA